MIFNDVTETAGRTPLVALRRITSPSGARLLVKLEGHNPLGSVKDRVGKALIEDAEQRGVLSPTSVLVEPTSGNMGISLAGAAAAKGYRLVLVMPERISRDRLALLEFLGAEILLTAGSLMRDAVARARELVEELDGAVMLQQFDNPANPSVHRRTTAEEIWHDSGGEVDVLVCGVGTGGTITGVGEVLKERRPAAQVVAVEPVGAEVLAGREPRGHSIPGLGAGFVPKVLNRDIIDRIVSVSGEAALETQRRLAREEGISAGMSSGAALAAALEVTRDGQMRDKTVVVVLPDQGERYLSRRRQVALGERSATP